MMRDMVTLPAASNLPPAPTGRMFLAPSGTAVAWAGDTESYPRWPKFSGMARISESNQSRPLLARLTGRSVRMATIYRRDGSRREVAFAASCKGQAVVEKSTRQ